MGPTGTGKTDIAIALSKHFPLEIISVDSVMVYRGMDIGTAKPSKAHPHYLIDVCAPDETYSAGQFCKEAMNAITQIENHHHVPLLAGGTMLYFRALQKGLSVLPPQSPEIRQKINTEIAQYGIEKLHQTLQTVDPMTAKKLHPRDTQRIQRALEVYELTGTPLSTLHQHQEKFLENHEVINIGLMPYDRQKHRKRLEKRFHDMLQQGFIDEVKTLMPYADFPSMRAVGYFEIAQYLLHHEDEASMIEKAIHATCQLAKRQMTWLRHFGNITFFDCEANTLLEDITAFLKTKGI
jgi:tRNA dimethylallyltransferase